MATKKDGLKAEGAFRSPRDLPAAPSKRARLEQVLALSRRLVDALAELNPIVAGELDTALSRAREARRELETVADRLEAWD